MALTQRTHERHMDGKIKTDVKPSAFAISLRQNGSVFCPSRGVNTGFGFLTCR
jgi:hypothetical protein